MRLLDHVKLKEQMLQSFKDIGLCEASAHHAVESMVQTSLRGVDSHGINLFPHYCRAIRSGRVNSDPQLKVEQSSASVGLLDSQDAIGHHAGSVAIQAAIKMAKEQGMAAVSARNSSHFGAAAYFALQAAEKDMIGMAFTNADALVKATGSKEAFFGTNPICLTTPLATESPFCLDMATSLVSWNKIKNYRREESDIPDHWAFDGEGQSVTNPNDARSLAPAGIYKGFGLGMMVDIFCAVLADGLISKDIMPMFTSPIEARRKVSHFFMVIDPEKFLPISNFKNKMQDMVDRIRELPRLDDGQEVMVPGDPEKKSLVKREKEGIPILDVVFDEYLEVSADFNNVIKA